MAASEPWPQSAHAASSLSVEQASFSSQQRDGKLASYSYNPRLCLRTLTF